MPWNLKGNSEATDKENQNLPAQYENPSEFMRARRPELFSDSEIIREALITREMFEYHLDTLTSRKQEIQFEHFCRQLAERELCPNLRPQTGPTGGGDSKADSETYPVADGIALRWYEGLARDASEDRWAFAFSTKKSWVAKAKSDIKGVAETGRDYKKVYFVTSQFAKDKARANLEDELSKKYGLCVVILDRAWISKCVFEHGRQELAASTLGMSATQAKSERVVGPRDAERESELQELEKQIADSGRYEGVPFQFVEDCLRAALLARGLERPRVEIEGRFERAERAADKADLRQLRLRVAYKRAWTAAWWFDDLEELNRLYEKIEGLAMGTDQAEDLELLANLWTVLSTLVSSGRLGNATSSLTGRTARLRAELERVASDESRPNNALQARTSLALMEFAHNMSDASHLDVVLDELEAIVRKAEGLIEYSLETPVKIIREMGDWLPGNDKYDALLETVVSVMQRRVSRGEAGRILLGRGFQKLRGRRPYDAIRLFGRAWQELAVREHREELIAALLGCGLAYESVGLLWAARANALAAANQALSEFKDEGRVTSQALTCLQKLVWVEIELGRVSCVLQWMGLASAAAYHLGLTDDRAKSFEDERQAQDRVLAILFLKADPQALSDLEHLPAVLERFGLEYSWTALLYALGYEDVLREQGVIPEDEDKDAVRGLFARWATQPAAADLPDRPRLLAEDERVLHSCVLGCEVTAHADGSFRSLFLGEQVLGALEGLLATSLERKIFPHSPDFRINVEAIDKLRTVPEYSFDEGSGGRVVDVRCAAATNTQGGSAVRMEWLRELVLQILPRIAMVEDLESYARQVFGEEAALGRALNFSDPSIPIENILGDKPKFHLADWKSEATGRNFPLQRRSQWNRGLDRPKSGDQVETMPRWGEGDLPKELTDLSGIKHRDLRVVSLINIALWDRAGWRAALYLMSGELDKPPMLGLVFSDREAARSIFNELLGKLGRVDEEERLRVSIITGIRNDHPSWYRVAIGSNPEFPESDGTPKHIVITSRVLEMEPESTRNLDGFLTRFERLGRYFIAPACFRESADQPDVFYDLCIGKRKLAVRPAWQIGEHDADRVALWPSDDPILPPGIVDAPVTRLLEKRHKESMASDD